MLICGGLILDHRSIAVEVLHGIERFDGEGSVDPVIH